MSRYFTEAEMQQQLEAVKSELQAIGETQSPPILLDGGKLVDQILWNTQAYASTKHRMVIFIAADKYRDFVLKAKFNNRVNFEPTQFAKLRQAGYLGTFNDYPVYTNEGIQDVVTPEQTGIFFLTK